MQEYDYDGLDNDFDSDDDLQGLDDFSDEDYEYDVKSYSEDNDLDNTVNKIVQDVSPVNEGLDENKKINDCTNYTEKSEKINVYKGIPVSINIDAL
jgi:hypothetical protein